MSTTIENYTVRATQPTLVVMLTTPYSSPHAEHLTTHHVISQNTRQLTLPPPGSNITFTNSHSPYSFTSHHTKTESRHIKTQNTKPLSRLTCKYCAQKDWGGCPANNQLSLNQHNNIFPFTQTRRQIRGNVWSIIFRYLKYIVNVLWGLHWFDASISTLSQSSSSQLRIIFNSFSLRKFYWCHRT